MSDLRGLHVYPRNESQCDDEGLVAIKGVVGPKILMVSLARTVR